VADTNPIDPQSILRISGITTQPVIGVSFLSSSNRVYTLYGADNLAIGNSAWDPIGQVDVRGTGGTITLNDTATDLRHFYRIGVELP